MGLQPHAQCPISKIHLSSRSPNPTTTTLNLTITMPPELIPDDEDYASSEDSDFAPDAAPAKGDDATSDEESDAETAKPVAKKRKRATDEEAEDAGFEYSGDEAIIGHAKRKRAKKAKKGDVIDEDEGGEGGLVKTRSMRAAEYVVPI